MTKKRKQYSSQFKFKVALEATQGLKTINEIASDHNLHPSQVRNWKKRLVAEGSAVFSQTSARQIQAQAARESELYEQIGRLRMELEWLKKKLSSSIPNTQSDMEKVNRFFNRYTSCLIKDHRRYYQLEESTVDSCVTIPVPTK